MSNEYIATIFRAKGIRNSEAKVRIMQLFLQESKPLSANSLHKILSKESAIDLATIYRNLNQFKETQIIREVLGGDESYFELALGYAVHPHFWCVECGKPSCLAPLSLEETLRFASFAGNNRTHSIAISMQGVCEYCFDKNKKSKG